MTEEFTEVKLKILDNDFKIRCKKDEADDLITSAKYVEDKMRTMRGDEKKFGYERIAVITALNTAHELLAESKNQEKLKNTLHRINNLNNKIETILPKNYPLTKPSTSKTKAT